MKKLTQATAIARMQASMPEYDYSKFEYCGSNISGVVICREHGEFPSTYDRVLHKHGCPKCYDTRRHLNRALGQDVAISRMETSRPEYDYSKFIYKGAGHPGLVICPVHGEFPSSYSTIVGGHGCPKCKTDALVARCTLESSEAISRMVSKMPAYSYNKFVYRGSGELGIVTCPHHGDFPTSFDYITSGRGCPKCGIERRTTLRTLDAEVAIQRMMESMPQYDYSGFVYRTSAAKGNAVCRIHGQFPTSYNYIVNGTGCPDCSAPGFNPKRRSCLYIYQIIKSGVLYLGYGITGSMGKRDADHQQSFRDAGISGTLLHILRFRRGYLCRSVEALISSQFEVVDLGIKGFRREATHWGHYPEVLALSSELQQKFGNISEIGVEFHV